MATVEDFDPEQDKFEIESAPEGYETDQGAIGDNREAAPPDGKDQDWTEIHPNGSKEIQV